jgi:hypothetical protein
MNKLKLLALAALVAVTVGVAALFAAPSASALPPSFCRKISQQADIYIRLAEESRDWVGLGYVLHRYYVHMADRETAFYEAGCTG